jgi:hypothetical protein
MVSTIDFSAGGFDARYGDKMSSVLDIKYRKPSIFRGSASVSLLGATAHFEDVSMNGRLAHISGIRYKTNRYMLGGLDEKGEYDPQFLDFQTYITYRFTENLTYPFLEMHHKINTIYSSNKKNNFRHMGYSPQYNYIFSGTGVDDFKTYLGALSANYHPNLEPESEVYPVGF